MEKANSVDCVKYDLLLRYNHKTFQSGDLASQLKCCWVLEVLRHLRDTEVVDKGRSGFIFGKEMKILPSKEQYYAFQFKADKGLSESVKEKKMKIPWKI